jgi:hypothetical protein
VTGFVIRNNFLPRARGLPFSSNCLSRKTRPRLCYRARFPRPRALAIEYLKSYRANAITDERQKKGTGSGAATSQKVAKELQALRHQRSSIDFLTSTNYLGFIQLVASKWWRIDILRNHQM